MGSTATSTTETVTADNVVRLFPDVHPALHGNHRTDADASEELQGYDEEQIRLMDEVCIVLDRDDNPIGSASKKTCMSRPQGPWNGSND
jgi:isopentenyl-diphosphate delta-isomerase